MHSYTDSKIKKLQDRKADYSRVAINAAAIQAHIMNRAMPKKQKPIKSANIMLNAGASVMEKMAQIKKIELADKLCVEQKKEAYINKLTLAQRIGLVEKPQVPLTDHEWKKVEGTTLSRIDCTHECPICFEKLGFMPQVVLNCTHVFHKVDELSGLLGKL
jgi:hypothetical protein